VPNSRQRQAVRLVSCARNCSTRARLRCICQWHTAPHQAPSASATSEASSGPSCSCSAKARPFSPILRVHWEKGWEGGRAGGRGKVGWRAAWRDAALKADRVKQSQARQHKHPRTVFCRMSTIFSLVSFSRNSTCKGKEMAPFPHVHR